MIPLFLYGYVAHEITVRLRAYRLSNGEALIHMEVGS